jgi:hypothetical protein
VVDASDRLAIHELMSLYGHLIDQRRWADLDQVFTDDVVFEGVEETTRGLREKVAVWTSPEAITRHPLAHHATNVVVTEGSDGVIRVISKGIGVRESGPPGSVVYEDVVTKTAAGWRISQRKATRRAGEGS